MAGAYGIPELKSARRKFEFTEESVTLTDEFDFDSNDTITERIASLQKPISVSDGIIELSDTKIVYDADAVSEVSVITEPLTRGDAKEYYLIDFKLSSGKTRFTATVI